MKAIFSGTGHLVKNVFSRQKKEARDLRCLIVADTAGYDSIKSILLYTNAPEKIVGRVAPPNTSVDESLGTISQLMQLVKDYQASEIIFYINGFCMKEAITAIEQLSPGISYKFHLEGSLNIVGSTK